MNEIYVLGPWEVIQGEEEGEVIQRATLRTDYPVEYGVVNRIKSVSQGSDHIISNPNLNLWLVQCNDTVLSALRADTRYFVQETVDA